VGSLAFGWGRRVKSLTILTFSLSTAYLQLFTNKNLTSIDFVPHSLAAITRKFPLAKVQGERSERDHFFAN
jgi:hypothetical protein